jgi:S1-C subfamily serine protease
VFIQTPAGTGSGALLDGGHVLTNAHVVWPYDKARVVLPDGTERLNVPVLNWDLVADLAILGPIPSDADPIELVDREDLVTGSEVFLIGYPGEVEAFPQPSITRGIVSRKREWEAIALTYFQTDAAVAAGQSGGVLVSEDGEVIGISGFAFTEAGFGLVASAADLSPRIRGLIDGEDIDGLGGRSIPSSGGAEVHNITLANLWDLRAFVIDPPAGTEVEIEVDGQPDLAVTVVDPTGVVLADVDAGFTGIETATVTTGLEGPHFVLVQQLSRGAGEVEITANSDIIAYDDDDDGGQLAVGLSVTGNVDHVADVDVFSLDLAEGQTVKITVASVLVDSFVVIDFKDATPAQVLNDDDSGGGLFGTDARIVYQAPHDGTYLVVVGDATDSNVGGYVLSVDEAESDAESVSPPVSRPAVTVDGPFGLMGVYESVDYGVSIQYPADWVTQSSEPGTITFASADGNSLVIVETDTGLPATLAEGADQYLLGVRIGAGPSYRLTSRETAVTEQDLTVEQVAFTIGGDIQARVLIYVHDDSVLFAVQYAGLSARIDDLTELIDYSFSTFRVESGG